MPKTIDMTPTWEDVLPLLVEVAAQGETVEARRAAMGELRRMAQMADRAVARQQSIDRSLKTGTAKGMGAPSC